MHSLVSYDRYEYILFSFFDIKVLSPSIDAVYPPVTQGLVLNIMTALGVTRGREGVM